MRKQIYADIANIQSKLNPRQKLFVAAGGLALVLLLLIYGGIFIQMSALEDLARSFRGLKQEEKKLTWQKEQAQSLQNEVALLETHEEALANIFLREDDLVEFVGMVEQSSRVLGLAITIHPRPDVQRRQGFAFRLAAEGSFPLTVQFIDELQNFPFFVRVESVSIKSNFIPGAQTRGALARGGVKATLDIFVPTKD